MKLLNPQGCPFPCGRGNEKELTMIVEVHGIGFWTRVRFPPGPLGFAAKLLRSLFYFIGKSFGLTYKIKALRAGCARAGSGGMSLKRPRPA